MTKKCNLSIVTYLKISRLVELESEARVVYQLELLERLEYLVESYYTDLVVYA